MEKKDIKLGDKVHLFPVDEVHTVTHLTKAVITISNGQKFRRSNYDMYGAWDDSTRIRPCISFNLGAIEQTELRDSIYSNILKQLSRNIALTTLIEVNNILNRDAY